MDERERMREERAHQDTLILEKRRLLEKYLFKQKECDKLRARMDEIEREITKDVMWEATDEST